MDSATAATLDALIRGQRVAALGTLRGGAPNVSLVAYLAAPDFARIHVRISRLAWHTQDLQRDPEASLLIAETDDGRTDAQTLARVTLRGRAVRMDVDDAACEALQRQWLARFPASVVTFELADFAFWSIAVRDARFVAGLGRTHNLSATDLAVAARQFRD